METTRQTTNCTLLDFVSRVVTLGQKYITLVTGKNEIKDIDDWGELKIGIRKR
jgi:hypothetical protein